MKNIIWKGFKEMANRIKNECAKTRDISDPYEIWVAPGWEWRVLKKWQADDRKQGARWYCAVISPYVDRPDYGDVFVSEIMPYAQRVK